MEKDINFFFFSKNMVAGLKTRNGQEISRL